MRTALAARSHSNRLPSKRGRYQPWLFLIARLVLAGFWIWAGASKVSDLEGSVSAVRAFRLLPNAVEPVVGAALPMVEIALGVTLLIGFAVRFGAAVSVVLQVAFLIGIISAAARGLRIDCGCFGGGGDLTAEQSTQYLLEIVRDSTLLLIAALLAIWPVSRFSLDNRAASESNAASNGSAASNDNAAATTHVVAANTSTHRMSE